MILHGKWFDRTREYRARKIGMWKVFSEDETVHLSALPCLAELDSTELRRVTLSLVEQIERETLQMHRTSGTKPAGPRWVMRQRPHRVPKTMKKSPARKFLAAFRHSIAELYRAYREFIAQYREASARLRSGDRTAVFPSGSFPPRLPFVRAGP
jgi:hypothetical protein